ncbi:MAG: hypothetical protein ACREDR_41475, partial [Blastocatellia bacterium]
MSVRVIKTRTSYIGPICLVVSAVILLVAVILYRNAGQNPEARHEPSTVTLSPSPRSAHVASTPIQTAVPGPSAETVATVPPTQIVPRPTVSSYMLFDRSFTVPARQIIAEEFVLSGTCRLIGTFQAQGGSGNDIHLVITDEMGVQNITNNHQYLQWYDSGKVTT